MFIVDGDCWLLIQHQSPIDAHGQLHIILNKTEYNTTQTYFIGTKNRKTLEIDTKKHKNVIFFSSNFRITDSNFQKVRYRNLSVVLYNNSFWTIIYLVLTYSVPTVNAALTASWHAIVKHNPHENQNATSKFNCGVALKFVQKLLGIFKTMP